MLFVRTLLAHCSNTVAFACRGRGGGHNRGDPITVDDDADATNGGDEAGCDGSGAKRMKIDAIAAGGLKSKYLPEKMIKVKSSLPKEILDLWEKNRVEGRDANAEFMNELFEKNEKGEWVVNWNKPYFKLLKERHS